MRNRLVTSLLAFGLILIFQSSCSNEDDSAGTLPLNGKRGARASCGQYYSERYTGSGFYVYPNQPLDFSGVCQGSIISVSYTPEDVPNRFVIKDNLGNIASQSGQQSNTSGHNGWIGTTSNQGPWGGPFSTGGSETVSFVYDSSKTYTLTVETVTQGVSDSWSVQIGCTTNCGGGVDPPQCSSTCGQYYSERYAGNGFYVYPVQALTFNNVCNGAQVNVSFSPEDVPDRFTIKDNLGNIVLQSGQQSFTSGHNGWIGTTSNSGPWGGPFSTGGSETVSFTYNSTRTYTLTVETVTQGVSDSWSVQIGCPNG